MFKRCKKILQKILQTKQHNTENISYRREGLPNEYRLSFPIGLAPNYQKALSKRVPTVSKKEILPIDTR